MASLVKSVIPWKSAKVVQDDMCEICSKRPKFVEGVVKHPYCGRTCAKKAQGPSPVACMLDGCRATGKPAFANFCSDTHARQGVLAGQVEACDVCHAQPRMAGRDICIGCNHRSPGPRLKAIDSRDAVFKSVRTQFVSEWESPQGDHPTIEKLYEIIVPRDVRNSHAAYGKQLSSAKEIRTFHSSECICDMGVKNPSLCNFNSCGICGIIKSSFKGFAFGRSCNEGRFGKGIYSYRNPYLADIFASSCTSSPYRVMIACDVILDSAVEFSDEESVFVETANAIIPAYVIMYIR